MAALRRGVAHYQDGTPDVQAPATVTSPTSLHYDNAIAELKLNAQEQALYQRHLSNLWGSGGVDHPNGARSSLYQAVQPYNGKFYNIPTVWDGKIETEPWTHPTTGKVYDVPNAIALQNVAKAGWDMFPSYATPDEADARYMAMHHYMERDTDDYFKQRNDAMAPQLRRGIAHYQTGTDDVDMQQLLAPSLTVPKTPVRPMSVAPVAPVILTNPAPVLQEMPPNPFDPLGPPRSPLPALTASPQPNRAFLADRAADPNAGRGVIPVAPPGATAASAPIPAPGAPEVLAPEVPVDPLEPLPARGPSGFQQFLSKQNRAALENPESSGAIRFLTGINQAADTAARARQLTMGPTALDYAVNFFRGNPDTDKALSERTAVARTFDNDLVQQHLIRDSNALAAAEKDPATFSKLVQLPEYINHMKRMQGIQIAMEKDPNIHPNDHPEIRDKSATHGVSPEAVNATIHPGKYARDEFARIMSKVPVATAAELFGPMFAHAMNPQESAMKKYVGSFQEEYERALSDQKKLEADPRNDQTLLPWGKSDLARAKERVEEARKARQKVLGEAGAVLQRGIP